MIQKESGYLSEQSNKLKTRSDSQHVSKEALKRKETVDQPNLSNSKQNITNNKNSIFKQFIAANNQYQSLSIDQRQKSPNTFNQINESDTGGIQTSATGHSGMKHSLPPKPSSLKSPQGKMKQQYSGYPRELHLNQQISNSKKQKGDHPYTHLSNFGMQAMGGSSISKVLQIKNQNLRSKDHLHNISSGDLLSRDTQISQHFKQPQSISFEDSKKELSKYHLGINKQDSSTVNHGEHNQIQNQVPLDGSLSHQNNNLNQALQLQIQPQKNKRGQRRHFPAKNDFNEFEFLMKNNQQHIDNVQPKVVIKQDQFKKTQISQSTGGKKLIRRGPFPAQVIFESDTQQQTNSPIINQGDSQSNIHQKRRQSNTISTYQKSIFQKNRHNIAIGSQNQIPEGMHSSDTPVAQNNYQFKGLIKQNSNSQAGANMMSQYGQNVLNRKSPKQQNNLNQNQYQQVQSRTKIGGRGYNLQIAQLQKSSSKKLINENPNNTSIGSNAEQATIAKENLFSPQPKPSSQMSQYGENSKNITSNTAQLIIRKAKAQNLEQYNESRHYQLNKTDEKQKSNTNINNDTQHIHNFRKYKKQTQIGEQNETNVLGQPKSQYQQNDEIQKQRNNQEVSNQSHMGTGIYQNQRRSYFTKQAPQTIQPSSIRRKTNKHSSIFNMTNFSGNDHSIQDVNYNIKGSKDTQRIAWEIKFNNQENQQSNDENQINQSQDFIYSELQKHRQTQNKSPLIKQFRQNLGTNRSNITGGGKTTKTTDNRGVKLLKVSTKTQRMNIKQVIAQGESPIGKATSSQTRSINFGALQHGSGETTNRDNPKIFRRQAQGGIKLKDLREQTKVGDQCKTLPTGDKQKIHKKFRIDNEKLNTGSFKKSLKTVRQQMQQIKQYDGELPAELIVTGYKKCNQTTINSNTQSNETKNPPSLKLMNFVGQSPIKNSKNPQFFNQKPDQNLKTDNEIFAYRAYKDIEKDEDFFKTTSENEFNEYMKQHHQVEDSSFIQSNEVMNPSANPVSDKFVASDSDISRDVEQQDQKNVFVENSVNIDIRPSMIRPQLENEIVEGQNQKSIIRNKISQQSADLNSINQSKMTPEERHHASHLVVQDFENSMQQKGQWSGAVSVQTQFLFNRVVRNNRKIHEKLRLLQDVGFCNESNSLFQQILEDIQAVERGMTKNEIINCIKASSFGRITNIEPHLSTDKKSSKIWLGVRRSQNQYQKDFQIESLIPDDEKKIKAQKGKSNSAKQFFWSKNTFSKNQNKRFHSKSYQQSKSPFGVDQEFLQQSVNFTMVRSLNFHSSHYNNSKGFKIIQRGCDQNSGRANTDRIGHRTNILKRSIVSLNQNRINLNLQTRRDVQHNEIYISRKGLSNDQHRQIQTERKYESQNLRKLCDQEQKEQHEQLIFDKVNSGIQPQQHVKVHNLVHPLQFQNLPPINSQTRYEIQNINKRNPNSDTYSQLHGNQELLMSNPHSSSECHTNPNHNVVLLSVKPSALLDHSQHQPISDNNKDSRHFSSNSFKTNQPKKKQIIVGEKKFTSYANHNNQDPVSSSSGVPSQSHNSNLPYMEDCTSSNIRYKRGAELQSSNGGNGNSCEKSKYNTKYNKSIQIAEGKKLEESGAFGHEEFNEPEQGKIFKWRQGEIIGLGSSSVVYQAIRTDTNQVIAVKKFRVVSDITGVDQVKLQTIKNEIQKYKQLDHSNIVKFYGCELLGQFFCLYLEKLDTSLANILSDNGYFDEKLIRNYAKQILEGLKFLHDKKIKHLDLKCSNILINNNKKDDLIKLCDFGSAREFKKGSNQVTTSFTSMKNQIVGSVQWMAPEVIAEEGSGSKSDIWSLGCTIVEMFSGGNPWGDKLDDQNLFQAQKIILQSDELPSLPEDRKVSSECKDFILQCLTREYQKRPSAQKLLEHPWMQFG